MAIISAGVIMNIIGTMFFAIVFADGHETSIPLNRLRPDRAPRGQFVNGVREGDTIYSINDQKTIEFEDILKETLLGYGPPPSSSSASMPTACGLSSSPPSRTGTATTGRPRHGFAPGLELAFVEGARTRFTNPGSPADEAGFKPGDTIVSISGTPLKTANDLNRVLRQQRSETARRHGPPRGLEGRRDPDPRRGTRPWGSACRAEQGRKGSDSRRESRWRSVCPASPRP